MNLERYLFIMPSDPEYFLCAVAAIRGLLYKVKERGIEPSVMLVCPNPETHFLAEALKPEVWCVTADLPTQLTTQDFELSFKFDVDAAKRLGAATEKHCAQVFALMLGGQPRLLPDLSAVKAVECGRRDLLVLPWHGAYELMELVSNNRPEKVVASAISSLCLEAMYSQVYASEVVMGVRSAATLLASALGKTVIEVYGPETGHRFWLSKWNSKKYKMIFAREEDVSPTLVYRILDGIWRGKAK